MKIEKLNQESKELSTTVSSMVITSQDQYEKAAGLLLAVKKMKKQVHDFFDPLVEKTRAAWKESLEKRDNQLEPVEYAENIVKKKIKKYENEQEQKRQEAEREAQRKADEQARKERERLQKRAEKAAEKGKEEKAADLMDQAAEVAPPPVTVEPTINRVKNLGITRVWKYKIENEDLIPREYMTPDLPAIGKVVRALKQNVNIPGVRVYQE